jgi:hypothetical protein
MTIGITKPSNSPFRALLKPKCNRPHKRPKPTERRHLTPTQHADFLVRVLRSIERKPPAYRRMVSNQLLKHAYENTLSASVALSDFAETLRRTD